MTFEASLVTGQLTPRNSSSTSKTSYRRNSSRIVKKHFTGCSFYQRQQKLAHVKDRE